MPQMSPLMWVILYIYFLSIMFMFSILMYYLILNFSIFNMKIMKNLKNNFKWLW